MNGLLEWKRIASTSEVEEGTAKGFEFMGLSLALYHVGDEWFCTDNVCTHGFALLTEGWLEGHIIECPLHAGQFDVRTGQALAPPVETSLAVFAVKIVGEDVMIALP